MKGDVAHSTTFGEMRADVPEYIFFFFGFTWIAIISLLAAACRMDCWNAAPVLATSLLWFSGDTVNCLEELVLLRAGLDLPPLVLNDDRLVCRMFWLTTRVPDLSMSKSLGSRDGWCIRCWFNSSSESSSLRMFLSTGFCRRLVRRSKSVWTWEATPFPASLFVTFCWTRSRRARALLASAEESKTNKKLAHSNTGCYTRWAHLKLRALPQRFIIKAAIHLRETLNKEWNRNSKWWMETCWENESQQTYRQKRT